MSMKDRDYSEKRDFIRMKVNTPAQVSTEPGGAPNCDAICNDLSGGGMSLTLSEELPLNSEITVTVTSDHSHSPILKARCCVARVEAGEEGSYQVGLAIKEVVKDEEQV